MKIIYYTHLASVIIFLLHYAVKTILIFTSKEKLEQYSRPTKVPEMILSLVFLGTGVYMLLELPGINNMMIIKIAVVLASIPIAIIGFKRKNKVLALFSFLMLIGAYGLAEMSKKRANKVDASGISGKELFEANCARCHGADGKAGLMGSKDLSKSKMDINEMMVIISEGKGLMTPYRDQLTEQQILEIARHVGTFQTPE